MKASIPKDINQHVPRRWRVSSLGKMNWIYVWKKGKVTERRSEELLSMKGKKKYSVWKKVRPCSKIEHGLLIEEKEERAVVNGRVVDDGVQGEGLKSRYQ